jgi:hypothetical protein
LPPLLAQRVTAPSDFVLTQRHRLGDTALKLVELCAQCWRLHEHQQVAIRTSSLSFFSIRAH